MSSGFITENEALEVRKKRQEEWERVRKADDPLERPEETFDHRSLFEKLQEQKQKRDLEYEEAHKLKNMIKGLDDDEIEFLDLIDRTKLAADRRKNIEEELELCDYRNRVASLQEKTLDQKLQSEINTLKPKAVTNNRSSQTKLLKGVVVKRTENRKRKHSDVEEKDTNSIVSNGNAPVHVGDRHSPSLPESQNKESDTKYKGDTINEDINKESTSNTGMQCIGVLPGLGCYDDSSSDASSNSEQEEEVTNKSTEKMQVDLLGRKVVSKKVS